MSSVWSASSLNVCRVHVIIDLSSGPTTQSHWVNGIVNCLKEGYRSSNDSVYLAFMLRQAPASLCRWFKCSSSFRSPSSAPVTPTRSNNPQPVSLTWDQLLLSLNDRDEEEKNMSGEELVAMTTDSLHALLDNPPWEPEDYVLTDVHILVSEFPSLSSLSLSAFTGACWRVTQWLGGSVHVTCSDQADSLISEWCESIPASINSSTFSTVHSLLWRGDLLISEQKISRQAHSVAVCPGLGLALFPDCPPHFDDVLTGIGLKIDHTHHPTHLELVQVIDTAALPHFYLSPLRCRLFLDASYQQSVSRLIFRDLFYGGCGRAAVLRLCSRGTRDDDAPLTHHRKTEEWMRHIVENEFNPNSPSLSHSLLPSTGPLILVPCSNQSDSTDNCWSCNGWFLWQPEHMMSAVQVVKSLQKHQSKEKEENDEGSSVCEILNGLPMMGSGSRPVLLDEQTGALIDSNSHQNEMISSPSSWFEMKALHNFEWIQRKMIKRLTTRELMFGEEIAPPPPTLMSTPTANDLLKCFTEQGSPASPTALSPLALKLGGDSSFPQSMITPDSPLPYHKVINSTPTTSRKYHGVTYCLSEEDTTRDARLSKIQRRYLSSERTCNCSSYQTPPRSDRQRKSKRKEKAESKLTAKDTTKINSSTASSDNAPSVESSVEQTGQLSSKAQEADVSRRIKQGEPRRGGRIRRGERGKPRNLASSLDRRKKSEGPKTRDAENIAVLEESSEMVVEKVLDEKKNVALREKKSSSSQGSSDEKRKRKHMLEKVVVQCLKEHDMSRQHKCFRKCYNRLFNLSKVFVQDLKFSADLSDEMRKIVDPNTDQVIQFELKQSGVSS